MPSAPGSSLPQLTRSLHEGRFLFAWCLGWAAVGGVVAVAIDLFSPDTVLGPALRLSVLFAEVVGLTALVSARLIFPLFARLPYFLFLMLQIVTLIGATVFGSITVVLIDPLFSFAELRTVGLLVLVNAAIAVIVGIALYTYDTMRRQIERSYTTLREKEALDRELRIAKDVQQELLPGSAPSLCGIEMAGVCRPAIDVGGDYYDFIVLGERQVGLAIGDVSGKGIPAALLMAGLHASVRSLSVPGIGPSNLNSRLNQILYRSSSAARYVTFFVGFFDADDGSFRYSNAGHHSPLLVGNGAATRLDPCGGLPIGMFEDSEYEEGSRRLVPGQLLAMFTDGVVEAPGRDGEEFGEDRLVEVLIDQGDAPLPKIVDAVLDELREWIGEGAPAHDDVTLVLARAR